MKKILFIIYNYYNTGFNKGVAYVNTLFLVVTVILLNASTTLTYNNVNALAVVGVNDGSFSVLVAVILLLAVLIVGTIFCCTLSE